MPKVSVRTKNDAESMLTLAAATGCLNTGLDDFCEMVE